MLSEIAHAAELFLRDTRDIREGSVIEGPGEQFGTFTVFSGTEFLYETGQILRVLFFHRKDFLQHPPRG